MVIETALTIPDSAAAVLEQVIIKGDLAKLSEADRVAYYNAVCQSLGLNRCFQLCRSSARQARRLSSSSSEKNVHPITASPSPRCSGLHRLRMSTAH